jgi:hypothetical protein
MFTSFFIQGSILWNDLREREKERERERPTERQREIERERERSIEKLKICVDRETMILFFLYIIFAMI